MDPVRRTILRDAIGVGVACGVYGMSFGVLAVGGALVTITPPGLPIVAAIGALVPAGLATRRRLVAA
jgi:hypothetical protein